MSRTQENTSPIREMLEQTERLLADLDDDRYSRKIEPAYSSTIGAHVRHCLDHFECLLAGLDRGEIDYDARDRDPRIEKDRSFALAKTRDITRRLDSLHAFAESHPIQIRCKVSYEGTQTSVLQSTIGRELVYCVQHAIHHFALIGMMRSLTGDAPVHGFGVAPSTLAYQSTRQGA